MIGRLGPHRVKPGDVFGRWTVVRYATPELYRARGARQASVLQHRVLARCQCNTMRVVWERDLRKGQSRGCPSVTCRNAHATALAKSEEATCRSAD